LDQKVSLVLDAWITLPGNTCRSMHMNVQLAIICVLMH